MRFVLAVALLFQTAACLHGQSGNIVGREIKFQGRSYRYEVAVPEGVGDRRLPALLLLHGAGGNASEQIAAWRNCARNNGILLIAPELPRTVEFEDVAAPLFRRIADAVRERWNVDPGRIYVFGHSMGGYLAFDAAMLESEYFAAVAVHASFISPEYLGILDKAARKIPIALYIGDRDPLVPLQSVRETRSTLESRGFPLRYRELPGHGHNYYDSSDRINADAWEFLRKQHL